MVRRRVIVGLLSFSTAVAMLVISASPTEAQQNSGQDQGLAPPPGAAPGGQGQGGGRGKAKQKGPSRPTPRWPDGHVRFGPLPGEKGVWAGNAGATLATNIRAGGIDNNRVNLPTNLKVPDVPFLPWARAVYDFRQETLTKDDPHVRCKPSGGPRLYHTPYGFEIVDMPEIQRVFIMGVGGPHNYRTVYMDGRKHPQDLDPTFSGHSIGSWDGDTLVVDTVGFNERFWLTREGLPHTEALHLVEKFSRPEYDLLRYEAIIEDPGAYTKPWSGGWAIPWNPNDEMYEFVCQDNNRDARHMYGGER